jgi:hypothetical protein
VAWIAVACLPVILFASHAGRLSKAAIAAAAESH